MKPTREDIELYVMGAYDGDHAALERAIDDDADARATLAAEAGFEGLLREAAAAAKFCAACGDLVRGARCDACGAAVAPGGYTVERLLVSNAHGRMYVARDADGKRVALKELAFVQPPSLATVAAFEREAKFLRALEHPAIPRFVASFSEGEGVHVRYYLAQELVVGEALDAHLDEHFYTEAEVIDIARQVLAVLVYLQSLSPMVIHRDIKPANLIKRADGTIAVVDFGAAYVQGSTVGSTTIGTFGYMPVEQLAGIIDATTDLYALGSTLLHLLTRQEPWRLMQGADVRVANVSRSTLALLRKLTAPNTKDRYANADAALAALDGKPVASRKSRRSLVWAVRLAAAAVVATGGGITAYTLLGSDDAPHVIATDTPQGHAVFVALTGFADRMCSCDDRKCAEQVTEDLQRWSATIAGRLPSGEADPADTAKIADVAKKLSDCTTRLYSAVPKAAQIDLDPFGRLHYGDALPHGAAVDLDVKGAPIHDVLRMLARQCSASLVVPDSIGANVTVHLKEAPCDQALEVLLETHGLAYTYDADARLLRVGTKKQLQVELLEARKRASLGLGDDKLPAGRKVDLDFKDVQLRDAIQTIANAGGVNVVIPDSVGGSITVAMKGVDWIPALRAILAAHGLGYRYRANGKLLRIGPQSDIDATPNCQPPGSVDPFDPRPVCATSKLHAKSTPMDAEVLVDGIDTHHTTPVTVSITPGKHRVTFVVGADRFTYSIDAGVGETVELDKDLR
jgi:serine/threonine protein kinase